MCNHGYHGVFNAFFARGNVPIVVWKGEYSFDDFCKALEEIKENIIDFNKMNYYGWRHG